MCGAGKAERAGCFVSRLSSLVFRFFRPTINEQRSTNQTPRHRPPDSLGRMDGQMPKANIYVSLFKIDSMLIERSDNKNLTITVSSSVDSFGLQRLIDYVKYLEATSKSKAKQSDVDKLADEVNAGWWRKNRKRFIK